MNKTGKAILTIYLCIFGLCFMMPLLINYSYVLEYVDLSPWDYQKLTDVEARYELIDEEGDYTKVLVTERITFDVHQASKNDLCYELWLDLPEQEVDGLTLDYTVISVSQIMDDGTIKKFSECNDYYWNNYEVEDLTGTWYHSQGPYSRFNDQYEALFFYVDGIYRDEVTFEVTYEMNNVALKYADCSDLYLMLYSESPIKDLESFKAEILIADKDLTNKNDYEYFTYGTNNNGFEVYESTTLNPGYTTFSIDLDEDDLQFRPYNLYLEFELVAEDRDTYTNAPLDYYDISNDPDTVSYSPELIDTPSFTDNARRNDYSSDYVLMEIKNEARAELSKPSQYATTKMFLFAIMFIITAFVLFKTFNTKKRMHTQHKFYEPAEIPEFYTGIPSDMDPNFAAALVFSKGWEPKNDSGVYTALLLSLARKGYVEIAEYGTNDAMLTIKNPTLTQETSIMPAEPLNESEVLYYNLLVRHSVDGRLIMSEFQKRVKQDYEYTGTFEENIKNAISNVGVNGGYVQKSNFTEPKDKLLQTAKSYIKLAVILLVVVNLISFHTRFDFAYGGYTILGITYLICAIYLKATAGRYVLLTQAGENEYAKWKGLYNYLKSDHVMSDSNIGNMPIWERFFIYATAFGIPTKVTKALGVNIPSGVNMGTEYYYDSGTMFSSGYVRTGRIHVSGRGVGRAVRSGARFKRASATSRGYTGGGRSWSSYGGGGS